ncbi:myb-like DNA-binding domain-containing protein [Colletotrichum sojae]|uniref:Myb-like DNA-binding domain-containing protein n=1 Tax=Colletotrichum sojae TaxID=2175907 RepID=A0A8H6J4K2_9PEZI|nr:myb-like DNA-binding domain-containing protein [Colletotrichum sojae]
MLSSISRMFRTSPSKNSSPGPTRPDREDFNLPTVSSTAPAETRAPIDRLDSSFSAMASAPEKMHTDGDDSDATDTEYVDPFADMIPFSTQVVSDDDDDDDGHQPTDQPAADDSVKASKKKSKKRKHAVAHSDSAETHDSEHSNKKTRKTKKRKIHKPAEDSDDDIMEDQADETTPEAPSERIQSDSDDLDDEPDVTLDVSVKSKPRASQRLSVTRQLFQRTKGEAITAVSSGHADNGDDASDADDGVSPSSPSIVAQRRRSMSRGSQISAARQGLSRESTSLPDRISEAAESADESSARDGDAGDFADQLPPSSQPPQEASSIADQDSSEVDSEDAESSEIESEDQLPRLPVNTSRGTLGATSPRKNLITYSSKDPVRQNIATPGRARQNAKAAASRSEPGNAPSSAGKSVRSTASRRQRSKPSFYEEKQSEAAHSDDEETAESRIILQSAPSVPPEPSQAARSSSPAAAPSRRRRQPKAESVKSKTSKRVSSRVQTNTGTATGFRSGAFSPEELANLTAAVSAYRDKHGYTQREMNELIQMKSSNVKEGNESGLKFDADKFSDLWNTICPCVPERTRIKIMAVARQQFHNFKARGSGWTPEEDAKLQELKDKHNGSWVLIGANLNRHPNDCRDRYRNYVVCGEYSNRQRWTEEEVKELVEHVMTSLRRLRTTKSAKPLISLLNWDSISAMMGRKRSRLQCIQKFKSLGIDLDPHERLRSLKSSSKITFALEMARKRLQNMAPEDKYTMVKAIFDLGTDKLNWLKLGVSKGFREKYCRSTQKLLWFRLKHRVPDGVRASARECARWLLDDAKANNPRGVKILAGGDDAYDTEAENNVCSRRPSRAPQEKAALSAAKITSDEDDDDEVEHDKDGDHEVERDDDHDDEVEGDEENETDDEMSGPGDGETQLPDSDEASSSGDETTATSADTTSASQPPDAFTLLPPTRGARKSKDPSPTKKRVRLSGGKSAKVRGDVEDDDEEAEASTPSQSQLGVRKIPDRLQEKKQAARRRISSGSRSRSVVSMPPESPNSNMEEDMPPIRVPASSQPVPVDAPPGTFARRTGSSVLPGQLAEPAAEVIAELEAPDTAAGANKRTSKRRRSKEVAESPS